MARKPKPEGKKYSYMDTYGDMVTLLLCFFVLLFAMSDVDKSKYNAFVQALTNQFGPTPMNLSQVAPSSPAEGEDFGEDPAHGDTLSPDPTMPADFTQMADAIQEYIEENQMESMVSVDVGASGNAYLRLSDALIFSGNSYQLRAEVIDFLDFLGTTFLSIDDMIYQVRFLGHTASVPGSGYDDWMLSAQRAGRVTSYFENDIGFSPYKMVVQAFGRHYPIADNSQEASRMRNRRVDIVVISNNPDTLAEALTEADKIYFPDDDTSYFQGTPEDLPAYTLDSVPPNSFDISDLTQEDLDALYNEVMNGR